MWLDNFYNNIITTFLDFQNTAMDLGKIVIVLYFIDALKNRSSTLSQRLLAQEIMIAVNKNVCMTVMQSFLLSISSNIYFLSPLCLRLCLTSTSCYDDICF
jgi:hypothetical protein